MRRSSGDPRSSRRERSSPSCLLSSSCAILALLLSDRERGGGAGRSVGRVLAALVFPPDFPRLNGRQEARCCGYEKACRAGAFAEPSDGLEPSTPSLPWNLSGNWWQPVATVLAGFRGFRV